ncbi:LPXTG cell wall anchor domain-containing protein [Candidatus Enterococcus clewellii]|uniref:Gram-positive cocci surface proteins LPxTG domain-containing protein n=1 Tax=Candidatus Enterococcus clewellii TaxID=1834193 RepID=A0AAQ3VYQ5_9ENTE
MKNTRISRLKRNKKFKQATKLLTVGLLICPLAINTIKALADEAETTPPVEQVEETPATIEETAPVEETETSEPVQPEVVEEAQPPVIEQPTETTQPSSNLQTSTTQEIAPQSNPVNAWYETEGQTTITSGDTASYKFYICVFYDDGTETRTEQTLEETGGSLISSDPSDVISGNTITFGSSGTRTIQLSLGTGHLDITVTDGSFTVSYNTRGNGSLSSYPTVSKGDGVWVSLSEMPIPTAGAGSHFKGWEVNGLLNGDMGWSSSIFSGFYVAKDTVVTAVFEDGDLDWSSYDNFLNQYLGYINLKSAYDEFGFTEEYDNLLSLYNYYKDIKAGYVNDPSFSQEELDRISWGLSGIALNLVDRHFFFDDNITPQITDYFNSLKPIYDDSTTYTPESKQVFNEAWENLQNALNSSAGGWMHEIDGAKYTAYQALKTAEQNLVKAETPAPDKTRLEQAIKDAEAKLAEGGWKDTTELETALATAKEVLANTASTQVEIDSALSSLNTATSALEKENTKAPNTTKLESSIKNAEAKLAESGYTAESMNALKQALQNAKDVLTNANSTQAEIDEAQKALDLAIANLVKEDNSNGGNTGNNSSNGTGNSTNNTNNQTSNDNQNSNATTIKSAGNNTNKDGLPQTGEQPTANIVIAGLSLTMLSILAWFKRKKV